MSKRDRDLKQRLEELFSSTPEPEPIEAAPARSDVTEPVTAGAAAAGQIEAGLFKTILDHIPLPIYIKDRDHKWIAANPAFCQLIGQPAGTLLGHVDKEQDDEAWRLDDQVLESSRSEDVQESTTAPDGTIHTRRVRHMPLSNAKNEIQYVLGIIEETIRPPAAEPSTVTVPLARDYTELQVELTEQRQNAARFRAIVEATPIPVLITRAADGKPLYVNSRASEMFGVPLDQMLYHTTPEFYHDPADRQKILAALQRDGRVINYEVQLKKADGTPIWTMLSVQPMTFNGEAAVLSGFYDITERKRVEAEVQRSAQMLHTLIDNLPDLIYIKNTKSEFVVANRLVAELANAASVDELIGKTDFDFFPPDNAAKFFADEQAILQSGKPLLASEETVIDPMGNQMWLSTTKVPFRNQQGEIEGIVGMGRDITDRKRADADRERLLKIEAKRAIQLQTAAEVAKAATSVLSLNDLLPLVVELIRERFDLYYVGLFLIDEAHKFAVLHAGTGEAGRQMLTQGHKLAVGGESMIGWCTANAQARIALDVGEDAVRFDNPLLPETHSEMALPLVSRGHAIGAMTIQSDQSAAFAQEDVAILQTMADQLANAIENAQLFEQARAARTQAESRLRELAFLQQVSRAVSSTLDLTRVLDALFDTLEGDMGFSHTALALFDPAADEVRFLRASGLAIGMQGLTRPLSQMQNDILVDVARKGQIEVIDGWDDRLDREIYEREGHANLVRAFVPLRLRDEGIGVLEAGYQRQVRARITPEEVRLLGGLADQVAIAVGNARLFEQARVRADQLAALNRIGQSLAKLAERSEILELVYQVIGQVIDNRNLYIALYDAAKNYIEFPVYTINGERRAVAGRPFGNGMTEYVIRTKTPLLIPSDVQDYSDRLGIAHVGLPAQCFLAVPMLAGDKVIGVVTLQDYERVHVFSNEHVELLTTITSQAAVALENAHLFEQARFRAEELAALNTFSQTLTAQLDVNQVLEEVLRGTSRLLDTANFYIALYDPAKHEVSFPINYTQSVIDKQITSMPADRGLTGYVIRTRKSLLIKENVADWQEKMGIPRVGESAQSWLGMPLMIGDLMLGVMAIQSYTGERLYDEHDQDVLTAIASQAAIAIQNARLFEQTQRDAKREQTISAITSQIYSTTDVKKLLQITAEELRRATGSARAVIRLGRVGLQSDGSAIQPVTSDEGVTP